MISKQIRDDIRAGLAAASNAGGKEGVRALALKAAHEIDTHWSAYSNEAGRVSRSYVGHTFQLDRGHRSNLIAAR